MSRNIGLFSGSFNPVHLGHITTAQSFIRSGLLDELWVYPTPDPPNKPNSTLAEFKHRLVMLELAFLPFKNQSIIVKEIESKLPSPNYTVNTLSYLNNNYLGHNFYLCIGSDSLNDLENWYQTDRLISQCEIAVVKRPGSEIDLNKSSFLHANRSKIHIVDHVEIDISSTRIRRVVKNEKTPIDLTIEVADYIKKNDLYTY